ncbi:hypothetical protein [Streptomyces sp. NBC_01497]|nr:hypothetical protein [Streptomyces sp. NBC_01497]
MSDATVVLREEEVGGTEWRPVDRVPPSLGEKLLELTPAAEPETANAPP